MSKRIIRRKRRRYSRPKPCLFCKGKKFPDYKEAEVLRDFVSPRGRMLSREKTGVCAKHQRKLAKAIKRARFLALLPFVARVK